MLGGPPNSGSLVDCVPLSERYCPFEDCCRGDAESFRHQVNACDHNRPALQPLATGRNGKMWVLLGIVDRRGRWRWWVGSALTALRRHPRCRRRAPIETRRRCPRDRAVAAGRVLGHRNIDRTKAHVSRFVVSVTDPVGLEDESQIPCASRRTSRVAVDVTSPEPGVLRLSRPAMVSIRPGRTDGGGRSVRHRMRGDVRDMQSRWGTPNATPSPCQDRTCSSTGAERSIGVWRPQSFR